MGMGLSALMLYFFRGTTRFISCYSIMIRKGIIRLVRNIFFLSTFYNLFIRTSRRNRMGLGEEPHSLQKLLLYFLCIDPMQCFQHQVLSYRFSCTLNVTWKTAFINVVMVFLFLGPFFPSSSSNCSC
ncbi:unnamed protein product [Amoebophrya sp. A25]|nr:unnamed protein product [Amoebophrya sp. A25]|eukprot:GSA25T00012623001.1